MSANVTGLASMVAYTTLMSLVPVVLLALFAVSVALESPTARATLITDLERGLPAATRGSVSGALAAVQGSTAELGAGALIASAWSGISVWSALDTTFRDIYRYPGRGWLVQKRWAARMLVLGLALVLAFIALPTAQALTFGQAGTLPFGLGGRGGLSAAGSFTASHLVLFGALCGVYHFVPPGRAPWRVTWPGALIALLLMTVVSLLFPLYLSLITVLANGVALLTFVVIVLGWFYLMALALLVGACVNAARWAAAAGRAEAVRTGSPPV